MILKNICALIVVAAGLGSVANAEPIYVKQGNDWSPELRQKFYTQDQGSRLMPAAWLRALKTADGKPFLHDSLARYGYLPMPGRSGADAGLPVGFTTNDKGKETAIGMSCGACHVREIEVGGMAYRIDGGPAIVDFQNLMADLDDATQTVLKDKDAFLEFADAVLGKGASGSEIDALRADFIVWTNRFHTITVGSLPEKEWGPSRLDALSMIINRLGGLDIGPADNDGIIEENIAVANAPARYPFLWNAAKQDFTQWPGFLPNGNDLFGLVRNLGEVYGVFADFRPHDKDGVFFNRDYLKENSANWNGLLKLENWLKDMGSPRWPWALDTELAAQGETVFNLATEDGGCAECHAKQKGAFRSIFEETWKTTVTDVGTDVAECMVIARTLKTGVMEGATVPFSSPMPAEAPAVSVLGTAVVGAILQNSLTLVEDGLADDLESLLHGGSEDKHEFLARHKDLFSAFGGKSAAAGDGGKCKYEGRVLDGIWAAAPYLHNGSVPTLVDLLKKPADRPASFKVGPSYDVEKVGLAAEQTKFDFTIETTGCDQLASGDSRCGHDYGTSLNDQQKKALIEYLKSI